MKLAIGNSRMDKVWRNCEMTWDEFCERVSITTRTPETATEYRAAKRGQQDRIKDVGGFVGGWLREGRRKNGNVLCRSMLTLDMDYASPNTWVELRESVDSDKIKRVEQLPACRIGRMMAVSELPIIYNDPGTTVGRYVVVSTFHYARFIYIRQQGFDYVFDAVRPAKYADDPVLRQRI